MRETMTTICLSDGGEILVPNRIIKESIKSSPDVDKLTWFEEVVFYRLIVSADDYGCFDGRPIFMKNALFPTKENVTKKSIEDAISKLVSVGLLCQYTVSGMPYLFFPTWEKHQRVRNQHRKYPEPPENLTKQTVDCHLTAIRCQSSASCQSESESESESESNPKETRAARFVPPTVDEVKTYCEARQNNVNPEQFVDFYESKGWMIGSNKMKDWKAAVRTWERGRNHENEHTANAGAAPTAGGFPNTTRL